MKPLRIFIGYDAKEAIAYHTLSHSILTNSTVPVSITPINLQNLGGLYMREHDKRQSNSFSFSRFLVPALCDYSGYALFMDCDMLMRADVKALFDIIEPEKAVSVVKHDYTSKVDIKYLGTKQYNYPRKNWSSVVLWNCSHPKNKTVTPEFVRDAEAATLHRFQWLTDSDIGSLPTSWNWLVGEYENPPKNVNLVHWTLGGPYFEEYSDVEFSDEWRSVHSKSQHCDQLNGND